MLDMLSEAGMLECKAANTSMDPNFRLLPYKGEFLEDQGRHMRLIGKLNYLTMTWSNIAYPVSVASQFMSVPRTSHWDAVVRISEKCYRKRTFVFRLRS